MPKFKLTSSCLQIVAVLIVFMFALGLRLDNLDKESFFMDEIHQASYYKLPLSEISKAAARQQQVPLDYWVGAIASRINNSDFTLRLPAAIFGSLSALLICIIAIKLTSLPIGIFIGYIFATLPSTIYLSQDLRPYSSSTFFVLAFIFILVYPSKYLSKPKLYFCTLTLVSTLLLLTRTLSPLVFVVSSGIFFLLLSVNQLLKRRIVSSIQPNIWLTKLALLLSFLIYLPYLLRVLQSGQSYLEKPSASRDLWTRVDFTELLNSWSAQLEPIFSVSIAVLISYLLAIFLKKATLSRSQAFLISSLILTTILHYAIFKFNTHHPFRPPYSIYAVPLILLNCAIAINFLEQYFTRKENNLLKSTLWGGLILIAVTTTFSTLDFKKQHIKTDWKGLSTQLTLEDNSLFISETLADKKHWSPGFYGFYRYPSAAANRSITVDQLLNQGVLESLSEKNIQPVIILFHYRNYFLTSKSKISLLAPSFDYLLQYTDSMKLDSRLNIKKLNGFTIIKLSNPKGNTLKQLSDLYDQVLAHLPRNSSRVKILLLSAVLDLYENKQQAAQKKSDDALKSAREDQLPIVNSVRTLIQE